MLKVNLVLPYVLLKLLLLVVEATHETSRDDHLLALITFLERVVTTLPV